MEGEASHSDGDKRPISTNGFSTPVSGSVTPEHLTAISPVVSSKAIHLSNAVALNDPRLGSVAAPVKGFLANPEKSTTYHAGAAIKRITKEIISIQRGNDLSLAVEYDETDIRKVRALIIGPPETPYEYGLFEFDIKFPSDYPSRPPSVLARTTNAGRIRFNPNIYADGKVCLSILGTWPGKSGEQWSSAQGLESLLLSIQSLMSSNPYVNEPGLELEPETSAQALAYKHKVHHETLRVAVVERMEKILYLQQENRHSSQIEERQRTRESAAGSGTPSDQGGHKAPTESIDDKTFLCAFFPLMKRRFIWYYDSYKLAIQEGSKEHSALARFSVAKFENVTNGMFGCFNYGTLLQRLQRIQVALDAELKTWADKGLTAMMEETTLAVSLTFKLKQLKSQFESSGETSARNLHISLGSDQNPFVWHLSILGASGTPLEGGMFSAIMMIPITFPEEQPRIRFQTPIYHRCINSFGELCYTADEPEQIGSHIQTMLAVLKDDRPEYDPRAIIHPEAFRLFWGSEDDRRLYKRRQRRSASDSLEYV